VVDFLCWVFHFLGWRDWLMTICCWWCKTGLHSFKFLTLVIYMPKEDKVYMHKFKQENKKRQWSLNNTINSLMGTPCCWFSQENYRNFTGKDEEKIC
jgi:hypothetical protein